MSNINVIDILKLGLPGLVFLLSLFSYRLLEKEQEKPSPNEKILGSIKQFMYFNVLFAVLTILPAIIDKAFVDGDLSQEVNVKLQFPQATKLESLRLVRGTYQYHPAPEENPAKLSGSFIPTNPVAEYWQATIPYITPVHGSKRIIILNLKDNHGDSWSGSVDTSFTATNLEKDPISQASNETHSYAVPTHFSKLNLIGDAVAGNSGPQNQPCSIYPTDIRFSNATRSTGERYGGKEYYEWKVYVDEDTPILNCISEVQYVLHSTFPNPLQTRTNRAERFSVIKSGWGVFTIHITVKLTNGETLYKDYDLDFNKPWQ